MSSITVSCQGTNLVKYHIQGTNLVKYHSFFLCITGVSSVSSLGFRLQLSQVSACSSYRRIPVVGERRFHSLLNISSFLSSRISSCRHPEMRITNHMSRDRDARQKKADAHVSRNGNASITSEQRHMRTLDQVLLYIRCIITCQCACLGQS